jgi:hypothetical protein
MQGGEEIFPKTKPKNGSKNCGKKNILFIFEEKNTSPKKVKK